MAFSTLSSEASASVVHLEHVLESDLVDLEIAAEQRDDEALLGLVDEALDHPRRRDAEELDDVVDSALARRFDLDHRRLGLVLPGRGPRARFGLLEVRPVAARGAADDGVLARVGEHHELLGGAAADRARVRLDDREIQAAAPEDLAVGRVLRLVGAVEPLGVHVEGVAVVHQELAPAHEPEPRPDLVAELGADLVQRHRKLAVGRHARAHHRRDGLLGRRREAVPAVLAVLEVEEDLLLLVARPAAALLPELPRLQDRQLHLEAAGRGRSPRGRSARSSGASAGPAGSASRCRRRGAGSSPRGSGECGRRRRRRRALRGRSAGNNGSSA